MNKASMGTRNEVIDRRRRAYQKACKREKGVILNEICASTGLLRDRAARLLRQKVPGRSRGEPALRDGKPDGRGRKPLYREQAVIRLLEMLWEMMDFACGKRLCPGLSTLVDALRRHGELEALNAPEWAIEQVLALSPATADRLLVRARKATTLRGRATTKSGTLRKKDIPIRLGNEWNENAPGFFEVDLVAHRGVTTAGEYCNTLDMTDIYSGWTETIAVRNKAQKHVFAGIKAVRARLPFPMRGIDSDNGGEFINDELYRYCQAEPQLLFTHSRPNKKNDNCHIEQKNFTHVRRQLGYGRYESQAAANAMNHFYQVFRLYSNFFLPSAKLIEKQRLATHGPGAARIIKRYDPPASPFRRLMDSTHITPGEKDALQQLFLDLNPAALRRGMMELRERILALALPNARPQN